MTIPPWLIQIGSITGLLTFAFTIWDRLLTGRPSVTLRPTYTGRNLHCQNLTQHDVVVKKIRCSRKGVNVSSSESVDGFARASMGETFATILRAQTERGFPLVFSRGELVDPDCPETFPFAIIVSWRKSRSIWLPQFPVILFMSARSVRLLADAR
jgi:hypothetical protein